MINNIPDFSNPTELETWLEGLKEDHLIEMKKASSNLPSSFWDSYSSFSNTNGGLIILGVEESKPQNKLVGVDNAEKIVGDFWNQVSNPQRVSFRTVENEHLFVYHRSNEKPVIIIQVKEAPDAKKPVYLNDKMENCYIRTGEGDRKCTRDELAAFLRNAQDGQDTLPAENFTMDDLDKNSLLTFKARVNIRYPKKNYLSMSDEDFLVEIGGASYQRGTGTFILKKGTVLFLGKVNAIHELYSHYHVDYFNRRGNNPRWSDRVTDDEPGDYEMNLFNFYSVVLEKLRLLQNEAFALDSTQTRMPISDFEEPLREALVNCLAHADYVQGYPSVKVEAHDGWFMFINPGKMLVSISQFAVGGTSKPRNEILMKMFRLLGASERQGFGGPVIYKTASRHNFRAPEIESNLEHTELRIWAIDLADSHPELPPDEKKCLRVIVKSSRASTIAELKDATGLTDYAVRQCVRSLVDLDLVMKIGNGRSTRYRPHVRREEFLAQFQIMFEKMKSDL